MVHGHFCACGACNRRPTEAPRKCPGSAESTAACRVARFRPRFCWHRSAEAKGARKHSGLT
eukprot:379812-Alexandrium_andersonii.AAC.1